MLNSDSFNSHFVRPTSPLILHFICGGGGPCLFVHHPTISGQFWFRGSFAIYMFHKGGFQHFLLCVTRPPHVRPWHQNNESCGAILGRCLGNFPSDFDPFFRPPDRPRRELAQISPQNVTNCCLNVFCCFIMPAPGFRIVIGKTLLSATDRMQ